MASFAYQAVSANGRQTRGEVIAPTRADAVVQIRRLGVMPLIVTEQAATGATTRPQAVRIDGKARAALTRTIGELATLLDAGLQLGRAVARTIDNIGRWPVVQPCFPPWRRQWQKRARPTGHLA